MDHIDHSGASPWDDVPSNPPLPQGDAEPPTSPDPLESEAITETPPKRNVPAAASSSTTGTGRGRPARGPKRFVTQTTKLESVGDTMDPLGPLGDSTTLESQTEDSFSPQSSGFLPTHSSSQVAPAGLSRDSLNTMMSSVNLEDEDDLRPMSGGGRGPPAVEPPSPQAAEQGRQNQPSVSIVEAAKPPFFQITVGDPHKVGDLTSAHTEYQVYTKTTSKIFRNPEFTVSRRFRDFLWLYNQLHQNNPGVVVPPPPEKQAVGRFNVDFVESRRQALERMLNKITAHPILQRDLDLKLFLESEAFNVDIRHRERKEPLGVESKGLMSSIGIGSNTLKFVEHDDWFHDRRVYLDGLENQLKALDKAIDTVISQRKALAEACGDFATSLNTLATVELSPQLSGPLDGLADLQARIRELYDRQAQQDVLTLGIVIDEYVRMIASCKMAFGMREKGYHAWQAAEADLNRKKSSQDKLLRQGRSQTDRLNQLSAEVSDAEKKAHQSRLLFEEMGKVLRVELQRFEREKVEDFKSSVETYLESAVEAQKELIEIWETYLMRMDAEEEEEEVEEPEEEEEEDERPTSSSTPNAGEGSSSQIEPSPFQDEE